MKYNLKKYPDGTSYINSTQLGEQVFKVNSYEDLWHLNQFIDAFINQYKSSTTTIKPNIIIPNLIDAQADRRFNKGESTGLKLVCEFLNSLNANFKVFHPHNSEVVEAMLDSVEIIDNTNFIRTVIETITDEGDYESEEDFLSKMILMSADAGGFKPLMKLCDKINWRGDTYSASKSRKYENGKSKLIQLIGKKDFEGQDIIIVDDLSIGGGTFKGLSKLLKERNVGKLYLAVSHMTVQDLGDDPVTNYFDKVFTTNSKFDNYRVGKFPGYTGGQPKNLEIISLF